MNITSLTADVYDLTDIYTAIKDEETANQNTRNKENKRACEKPRTHLWDFGMTSAVGTNQYPLATIELSTYTASDKIDVRTLENIEPETRTTIDLVNFDFGLYTPLGETENAEVVYHTRQRHTGEEVEYPECVTTGQIPFESVIADERVITIKDWTLTDNGETFVTLGNIGVDAVINLEEFIARVENGEYEPAVLI